MADVYVNKSSQNYLIQHSAGSGKTNSIAWLAHRLTSLHDENNKVIFDNVVIVTDRVVVDRQLQQAVQQIEHQSGLIKVMDDKCTSADLADALKGNTKIIATTIQKFPYIVDTVSGLKNKNFAVIVDEAHSSTAGKNMAAVTSSLGAEEKLSEEIDDKDTQDKIVEEIAKNGKQPNVSIFAFTATPKHTTLELFGRKNAKGQKEAFHLYSMKQAIEEGFILDVLANYTTYKTFYELSKKIADDPEMKSSEAKRKIARFIELHETNIAQRIEVIVEHFRQCVMHELGGKAKAMVVTASREGAVKYRQALENYITKHGYKDIHALVAFSGKVKLKDDENEYTESGMSNIPENRLAQEFDTDKFNVLLVANKYQTGFDQPMLCAMYVLKTLKGVAAVQTLSRLNRTCLPFDKKTFVLDFVNTYEDITKAFAPFYTTTLLSNSVTPESIYDLESKIDGYFIIRESDIEELADWYYKGIDSDKTKFRRYVYSMMQSTKRRVDELADEKQKEFIRLLKSFVRFYEFLLQASCFEDTQLHKKYKFISVLIPYLNIGASGEIVDLEGKLKADRFVQQKTSEHTESHLVSDPIVSLPSAESLGLTEEKEKKLSEIIAEINSRTGKNFNNDVAVKSMLQIKDFMMQSKKLKDSAKNNTEKDLEFAYYDNVDDALIQGLDHNQEFFSMLLNNKDLKKQVLGIFADEIYKSLRTSSDI